MMNNIQSGYPLQKVDALIKISACISDTILRALFHYGREKKLFGYIGAIEIIKKWTEEFCLKYFLALEDWDGFEETDNNEYNSSSWDDFLVCWVNDQFERFKFENDQKPVVAENQLHGSSKTPRLVIALKNHKLFFLYSTVSIIYAYINYDKENSNACLLEGVFEPDTIARDLSGLFDSSIPMGEDLKWQLIYVGF